MKEFAKLQKARHVKNYCNVENTSEFQIEKYRIAGSESPNKFPLQPDE